MVAPIRATGGRGGMGPFSLRWRPEERRAGRNTATGGRGTYDRQNTQNRDPMKVRALMGPTDPFDQPTGDAGYDAKFGKLGLTFDDVMLLPADSGVLPKDVETSTRFARDITLKLPVV